MCDISILTGAGCSISTTLRVFAKQLAWRNPSTLLLTPKYAVTAWKRGFLRCLYAAGVCPLLRRSMPPSFWKAHWF